MATHSGILAWEIPWIEEPGGLYPWTVHGIVELDVTWQLNNNKKHKGRYTVLTLIKRKPRVAIRISDKANLRARK